MTEIKIDQKINLDDIGIDEFWNVGNEKEDKRHKIHSYPAKFPAFITQKAIDYANEQGIKVSSIADIFCGCGTVALEAKRKNIDFWGCDINPVAVLIAKTKSYPFRVEIAEKYSNKILETYVSSYTNDRNSSDNVLVNQRIQYWYEPEQIKQLTQLKKAIISQVPANSPYRQFFLCAFSNILKPTSKWLTKSIKPQIDPNKRPESVEASFRKQCKFMLLALAAGNEKNRAKVKIERQNALAVNKHGIADLIVTSPPYVTSYEYADLHQLSSLWLDYTDDYRKLRVNSIGSAHLSKDVSNLKGMLLPIGQNIVNQLLSIDKAKALAVTKYYLDMQQAAKICFNLLKPQGICLIVIGNTEYKQTRILNAEHIIESLNAAGFSDIKVTKRKIQNKILTPYRDEKGKFSRKDNLRKIYSDEFIVIGRKNK